MAFREYYSIAHTHIQYILSQQSWIQRTEIVLIMFYHFFFSLTVLLFVRCLSDAPKQLLLLSVLHFCRSLFPAPQMFLSFSLICCEIRFSGQFIQLFVLILLHASYTHKCILCYVCLVIKWRLPKSAHIRNMV